MQKTIELVVVLALVAVLAAAWAFFVTSHWSSKNNRHRRYRGKADRVREQLSRIDRPGARLSYLRKINPYVFEELVLTSYEESGCRVRRSVRYSGDGGCDGEVFKDGQRLLLQCKRYRSHIDPRHVEAFARLCNEQGCRGVFVHTGRTGKTSWDLKSLYGNIQILSGNGLLDLVSKKNQSNTQKHA